ncbi:MAG: inorganic phosphate transporter, partial [Thermodesulfobacteriota bacterium]
AAAIALGTFTYGKRVMLTVGEGITEMSPVAALVAVLANALVLFLFASQGLERLLLESGLPAFPLVPVSSSQAIVGSVIGIALVRGGRGIRWRVLGEITGAWLITPLVAVVISFIALFFLQNVFQQKTFLPVEYRLTAEAEHHLKEAGIPTDRLAEMRGKTYPTAAEFEKAVSGYVTLNIREKSLVLSATEVGLLLVDLRLAHRINDPTITESQKRAVQRLAGKRFVHRWQLEKALAEESAEWRIEAGKKERNREIRRKLDYLHRLIRATQ